MTSRKHTRKPLREREIALERIDKLFFEADSAFKERPDLSKRYVELARKIAMRLKVRIRPELKRRFCKHCHSYLRQGVNCRVRVRDKLIVYYCSECKGFMRFPYKAKAKKAKTK